MIKGGIHLLLATLVGQATAQSIWGQRGYNAQHSGRSGVASKATGAQLWNFTSPGAGAGNTFSTSPAISASGVIFVGGRDGGLVAIDGKSRTQLWRYQTAQIDSSPAISTDGSTVFVGSDAGKLHAVDAVTGKLKWNHSAQGEVNSSPCVSATAVFFAGMSGRVTAVAAASGHALWSNQMPTSAGPIGSSPCLSPDGASLFIGADDGLYSFSAEGGVSGWHFKAPPMFGSPAMSNDGTTVFSCSTDGYIYAVLALSGQR